ncbi:MAG: gmr 1 [Pseudonocardiales bacterium]|nr:gmr 1 [Pseudonocardiales bacterium]
MDVRRHEHEADRLDSVASYRVMDVDLGSEFDAFTRLAAQVCDTPISLISMVGDDRQWYLSHHGVRHTENTRSQSLCSDVVADGAAMVMPDLATMSRYRWMTDVSDPTRIRSYAGVPLIGRDGLPLGTLCVMDTRPRRFNTRRLTALADLAHQVVAALELRRSDRLSGLDFCTLTPDAGDAQTLRRALTNGEFVPYFQPVVNLRDGTICGLEALIRWQHPTLGLLAPDAFLPALEVGTLSDWTGQEVLDASCRVLVELRTDGTVLPDGVAVNVSGRQLTTPGLAKSILSTLARFDLPGSALTVEVTETATVLDVAVAHAELATLRLAGVRVLADDFGVGWSNLVGLLQLPFSGLKIDKQLVTAMSGDPIRRHMVSSTIGLARAMGLDVIAEGVETEAVSEELLSLGCVRAQGWLFSRAVPAENLSVLLASTFPGRSAPTRMSHPSHPNHARPVIRTIRRAS